VRRHQGTLPRRRISRFCRQMPWKGSRSIRRPRVVDGTAGRRLDSQRQRGETP
jgi:hypothetical protein